MQVLFLLSTFVAFDLRTLRINIYFLLNELLGICKNISESASNPAAGYIHGADMV